ILTFVVTIFLNLLAPWYGYLIALSIDQHNFFAKHLVDFSGDNFTNDILILLVKNILLKILHFLHQCLAGSGYSPAAEVFDVDLLRYFFPDFKIRLDFTGFRKADLIGIPDVFRVIINNFTNTVY